MPVRPEAAPGMQTQGFHTVPDPLTQNLRSLTSQISMLMGRVAPTLFLSTLHVGPACEMAT